MMRHPENSYLDLLNEILENGKTKKTRGIHSVKSVFGYQLKFDLRYGFPLLTTKKMPFKVLLNEFLWFLSGNTNIKKLNEKKIFYWDGFADKDGDLGPVYGHQWRKWPTFVDTRTGKMADGNTPKEYIMFKEIDQLQNVIDEIIQTPNSKLMMVSALNPSQIKEMRLPPCHTFFQFNVIKDKLKLQMYQRSSDVFLGLPFNIAQYALMLYTVANITNLEPRELIISIGDAHLYNNHIDSAKEQLKRMPKKFPKLKINKSKKNIDDFTDEDFAIVDYEFHPHIKADLVII